MKLHEVKNNSNVYVKKKTDDIWITHKTKEDKTYHAEEFSTFEVPFGQLFSLNIVSSNIDTPEEAKYTNRFAQHNEFLLVQPWDTEWEMLVRPKDVRDYVNIPKNDY